MTIKKFSKKLLSVLLCIAMLVTSFPMFMLSTGAAVSSFERVSDPTTMDSWKELFPTTGDLTTENAGSVWTDKSVFTDASAFAGITGLNQEGISQDNSDSLLVALSAMGSTMSVTGMSGLPTDTMLVLDVSGSMNNNKGNNDCAEELVAAANQTIHSLLQLNSNNRVGVVMYSGTTSTGGNATSSDAVLMLPLGRYDTETYVTVGTGTSAERVGQYLRYSKDGGDEFVSLYRSVTIEGTDNAPSTRYVSKEVVGATNTQRGIILAKDQFVAADPTFSDPVLGEVQRMPVMVLMSDGLPTIGNTNFTVPTVSSSKKGYDLGDGTTTTSNAKPQIAFVTQLSAAYAKQQIEAHYSMDSLFYTMGLGDGIASNALATSVLDPKNSASSINSFWKIYNEQTAVGGAMTVEGSEKDAKTVVKIKEALDKNYVDKYFKVTGSSNSDLAQGLKDAFLAIVSEISLQSKYFPTLVKDSEELSGYVSFVDKIGKYMQVTDIKGIVIGDKLFTGADLASNFKVDGGFGSIDAPTDLGDELIWSIKQRLGITDVEVARSLVENAYNYGQLRYTDEDDYSNYIGWYANAQGKFLGFYHEGVTDIPAATGNADTDPVYTIKSYGYLGETDPAYGVTKSDMMYATVQVRHNIVTGEEMVAFAVPAALIPVITYNVTLNDENELVEIEATEAQPIRLVFEVALDENINEYTVLEAVDPDYVETYTDENGRVCFYSNNYEVDNQTGYDAVNTYSYFSPSRRNDRYYYTENSLVYTDTNGTLYEGDVKPADTMYRSHTVYEKNGLSYRIRTGYHQLTDEALETAVKVSDVNSKNWYIPAGNVRMDFSGHIKAKSENLTDTFTWSNVPFVDTYGHHVNDVNHSFVAGETLGNNGRISILPATGIKITKAMAEPVEGDPTFDFIVTNISNPNDNSTYTTYTVDAKGNNARGEITFSGGSATVTLGVGDTLYIGSMRAGDEFTVKEVETIDYIVRSVNGDENLKSATLRIAENAVSDAAFVNAERLKGNLTISKVIEHDFGEAYTAHLDKEFEISVTLDGIGTKNATFKAKKTGSTIDSITTDENGKFTVTLKHNEQLELFELPDGTIATVVEQNPGAGFIPNYWDNGEAGDGVVAVRDNKTVSVIVLNDYTPARVYPVMLTVSGTKTLSGRPWQDTDSFTFELQKYMGEDQWKVLATDTVKGTDADRNFDFNGSFANEEYTAAGTYYYRVVELSPESGIKDGVSYDKTVHSFGVKVTDADMNGKLEISEVVASRPQTTHVTNPTEDTWHVDVDFTNNYYTTGVADVTIELNKSVVNVSGSTETTLAGYSFSLYNKADGSIVTTSGATTSRGFARLILDNYTTAGTYEYILKEDIPTELPKGWTYSTKEVEITVVVTDNLDGTLSAVVYDNGDNAENRDDSIAVGFQNIYTPESTSLDIDFVYKKLVGRDAAEGEFTFALREADSTENLMTGSNSYAANGDKVNVVMKDAEGNTFITYDKVGVYFYNIVELNAVDSNGITYDKNTYRVTVEVADIGGTLEATYVVVNAEENDVVFTNTYTAKETKYTISGNKFLSGKSLMNDAFTFVLTEALDENGNVADGATVYEKTNTSGTMGLDGVSTGTFTFPEFKYTEEGIYYYTLSEKQPVGNTFGVAYDTNKYVISVEVCDNGLGQLYVNCVYVNGVMNAPIAFTNIYTPTPTTYEITATKTLLDKALEAGKFSFELYESDAEWSTETYIETVTNTAGADDNVKFTPIEKTGAGTYYYTVKEVGGGTTAEGIKYDGSVFRIVVTVKDDYRGTLTPEIEVFNVNGITTTAIFVNDYDITGTDSVTFGGTKHLNGRTLADGEFSFALYETDSTFAVSGGAVQTVKNAEDKYSFTINYDGEDAEKTFYYVVHEVNAGLTVNGVTHSSEEYHITVTVSDLGNGNISAVESITNSSGAAVDATELDFTNEYSSDDTAVSVSGRKELDGIRPVKDSDFTFKLYKTDSDYNTVDDAIQTVTNGADKAFVFADVTLDTVGTYYFVVREDKEASPIGGVDYDDSEYRIEVVVSDDGAGQLYVSGKTVKHYSEQEGLADADEIVFNNTYTAKKATYDFKGFKELLGIRRPDSGEFTFELYRTEDNTFTAVEGTEKLASNDGNGAFAFEEEEFTAPGEYYFVIRENSANPIGGVGYDTSEYHITVTVADDEKGSLYVSNVLRNHVYEDGTSTVEDGIMFVNSYSTAPVSNALTGIKKLEGRAPVDGEFTFVLSATNSRRVVTNHIQTVTNVGEAFSFDSISYDAPGSYYYLITEDSSAALGGVTYDASQYYVEVKIADDKNGNLYVEDTLIERAVNGTPKSVDEILFENTYSTHPVHINISGVKELDGRDRQPGEFSFDIFNADENFVISDKAAPTATNDSHGNFSFATVRLATKGVHNFVVREDSSAALGGVDYDTSEYRITVTVADDGVGNLYVESKTMVRYYEDGTSENAETVLFENSYIAAPTYVNLGGTKYLDGRDPVDGEFSFDVYRADENFVLGEKAAESAVNGAGGSFSFAPVELSTKGMHYLVIKEDSSAALGGVGYDDSEYRVTVSVSDDGNGNLSVDSQSMIRYYKDGTSEVATAVAFNNTYSAESTYVNLGGTKYLTGRELNEGEFSFDVYNADANFVVGAKAAEPATNGVGGAFAFAPIALTEKGTHYFVVKENTDTAVQRISYDYSEYLVTVEVTDDGMGHLVAADPVIVKRGTTEPCDIVFNNTYTPKPDDITLDIAINKTVVNKGTGTIGPEGFNFTLTNTADGSTVNATTGVEGTAKYSFTYTESDIGMTYTYKIVEVNEGLEDIKYSEAEYTVSVEITLDANNKLVAAVKVNDASVEAAVLEFVNEYDPTETELPDDDPQTPPETPDENEGEEKPETPPVNNQETKPETEKPAPAPEKGQSPQTGDGANLVLWLALISLCGCGLTAAAMFAGKKKEDEQ